MQNKNYKIWVVILTIIFSEVMILHLYKNYSKGDQTILIIYHGMLIAAIQSYYKTATTNPGNPIRNNLENNEEITERRVCKFCQQTKPSRCHHCRNCKQCILRMDHHSQFTNNCIGKNNYKFYFCLLLYSTLTSIFYLIVYIRKALENPIDSIIIIFALLIVGFTVLSLGQLTFHIKLIMKNKTTLEHFEKKKGKENKNAIENFQEFLGPGLWLVPF